MEAGVQRWRARSRQAPAYLSPGAPWRPQRAIPPTGNSGSAQRLLDDFRRQDEIVRSVHAAQRRGAASLVQPDSVMDAAETSTLIRARCPELSSRDLEVIEAALSGEEMLPMKRARSGPGAAREARGSVSRPWKGEALTA